VPLVGAASIKYSMQDEEFPSAFGMTKEKYEALKPWTQKSLLEKAKLF